MGVRKVVSLLTTGAFLVSLSFLPLATLAAIPASSAVTSTTPLTVAEMAGMIHVSSTATSTQALPSCFDYYTFGSVPVVLSSSLSSVIEGTPLSVTASIENKNNYPIVDAALYIRVFKEPLSTTKNVNGPDVVDFFPVAQNISLKANQQEEMSFTWNVPSDADSGNYEMVPFVVQDSRFNFLGLTFTDDITGPPLNFSITNTEVNGGIRFDRTDATLNGQPYYFAAYSPIIAANVHDVPVTLSVNNTTNTPYSGQVTWSLYYWDGLKPGSMLSQSSEAISVGSGASTTASYTVTDEAHSVYYLTAELSTKGGSKSIAAVRFVRAGVNEPRLSSVDVSGYPLAPGSVAFACFHSAGSSPAGNVEVKLAVKTIPFLGISWPLASRSYSGDAPGNLVALTIPVASTYDSFELVATLFQNGNQIDQVTVPYSCSVLGSSCKGSIIPIVIAVVVAILVILLLVIVLILVRKHKKRNTMASISSSLPVNPTQPPV